MYSSDPIFGQAYTFDIGLIAVADDEVKTNPTIASGDFKRCIDGGALTNLDNLPTVTPSGGPNVRVTLSAAEMTSLNISVYWKDVAGNEWRTGFNNIQPKPGVGFLEYGVAQGATSTTLQIRAAASYADNILRDAIASILAGTGAGQSRTIASNVGSTDTLTVNRAWDVTPDSTSVYGIMFAPAPSATPPDVNVATVATDAISAASLSSAGVTKIVTAIFARTFHATKMAGLTFSQVCAVIYSVLANKITGLNAGSTGTAVVRNASDTATVVSAPFDADGNRTSTPTITTSAIE